MEHEPSDSSGSQASIINAWEPVINPKLWVMTKCGLSLRQPFHYERLFYEYPLNVLLLLFGYWR